MQSKLNFVVLGAQKCATSWLYYCLKEHPQLQLPNDKREIAYIGGELFQKEGAHWFFDRYSADTPGLLRGDVSVDYLPDMNSASSLEPYVKDPKFIAVIRNPVDRMVSAYFWCVRVGQLPNRPIEEAFEEFLEDAPGFPVRRENRFLDELVRRSFYAEQLEQYASRYGRESLLILLYDDIVADGAKAVCKIYQFLGVDERFVPESINVRPKVNSYNRALIMIQNAIPFGRRPVAKVLDHINRRIAPKKRLESPLPDAMRKQLATLFRPHVVETINFLEGLPLQARPEDIDLVKRWSIPEFAQRD